MATSNPVQANTLVIPIDGTAAAPSVSFGGNSVTPSGTGLYGTYGSIKHSISGTLALTLDATALTLASGNVVVTAGNLTLTAGNLVMTSGNLTLSSGNIVVPAANTIGIAFTLLMAAAGAPTDGVTGAATAGIGSLYSDITAGKLYINTGTKASPTWTVVGTQS